MIHPDPGQNGHRCFCPKCIEGKGECDNLLYTKQWQMHTVSKNVHQPKPVCFDTLSMQLNEACTYAALEVVCRQHSHLASQHPLGIASLSAADPVFTTDVDAASVFPKDTPRLTPLAIAGDGNCLPRCASVLVYGDEEHHTEMRARIILELVLAQECYLDESFLQDGCQGSKSKLIHIQAKKKLVIKIGLVDRKGRYTNLYNEWS